MSYFYRDVFAAPSGQICKVRVTGRELTFDNDPPILLPEDGMFVRCWTDGTVKLAAVKLHDSGDCLWVRSKVVGGITSWENSRNLGPTLGNWPAAFAPDGRCVVRQRGGNQVEIYSTEGDYMDSLFDVPWASEGLFAVVE